MNISSQVDLGSWMGAAPIGQGKSPQIFDGYFIKDILKFYYSNQLA